MSDELIKWEKERGRRTVVRTVNTTEGIREKETKVETLPQEYVDRIEELTRRVRALEEKPTPLIPSNANEQVVIPKGVTDLVERVSNLESRSGDGVSKQDLDALAEIIETIGQAALTHAGVLTKRIDALEARVSNLPSDLLVEVGRAQAELSNRRA